MLFYVLGKCRQCPRGGTDIRRTEGCPYGENLLS
nr:MAG TPA_asm: hypothetical protein [Caudoviricetes sp.]